jgi:hypothetical protein
MCGADVVDGLVYLVDVTDVAGARLGTAALRAYRRRNLIHAFLFA